MTTDYYSYSKIAILGVPPDKHWAATSCLEGLELLLTSRRGLGINPALPIIRNIP